MLPRLGACARGSPRRWSVRGASSHLLLDSTSACLDACSSRAVGACVRRAAYEADGGAAPSHRPRHQLIAGRGCVAGSGQSDGAQHAARPHGAAAGHARAPLQSVRTTSRCQTRLLFQACTLVRTRAPTYAHTEWRVRCVKPDALGGCER
eukprot:6204654-Pleurochrysis_carterae.AAC.2